ncbi:Hypothetical_protein [Hexamita inflata]|uniref:Hypothetical_protein n=1 Tax=Hexamita inflata TaxID=28002 RepID=A0AA86Q2Q6_9EUKA|nr:Hypothetical protein HINF_LOCUS32917 [Hexamita inflata]
MNFNLQNTMNFSSHYQFTSNQVVNSNNTFNPAPFNHNAPQAQFNTNIAQIQSPFQLTQNTQNQFSPKPFVSSPQQTNIFSNNQRPTHTFSPNSGKPFIPNANTTQQTQFQPQQSNFFTLTQSSPNSGKPFIPSTNAQTQFQPQFKPNSPFQSQVAPNQFNPTNGQFNSPQNNFNHPNSTFNTNNHFNQHNNLFNQNNSSFKPNQQYQPFIQPFTNTKTIQNNPQQMTFRTNDATDLIKQFEEVLKKDSEDFIIGEPIASKTQLKISVFENEKRILLQKFQYLVVQNEVLDENEQFEDEEEEETEIKTSNCQNEGENGDIQEENEGIDEENENNLDNNEDNGDNFEQNDENDAEKEPEEEIEVEEVDNSDTWIVTVDLQNNYEAEQFEDELREKIRLKVEIRTSLSGNIIIRCTEKKLQQIEDVLKEYHDIKYTKRIFK